MTFQASRLQEETFTGDKQSIYGTLTACKSQPQWIAELMICNQQMYAFNDICKASASTLQGCISSSEKPLKGAFLQRFDSLRAAGIICTMQEIANSHYMTRGALATHLQQLCNKIVCRISTHSAHKRILLLNVEL
jgi:hypothetical protein